MQFTARQLEIAQHALLAGQPEARFARDNAMRPPDVAQLYARARESLAWNGHPYQPDPRQRLCMALNTLMTDAECVDLFCAECRMKVSRKALRHSVPEGPVAL